jgi:hypothetical protein
MNCLGSCATATFPNSDAESLEWWYIASWPQLNMCPEEKGRLLGEEVFENGHLQDQNEENIKVGYI